MKAPQIIFCVILCATQLFSQYNSQMLLDFEAVSTSDSTLVFGNYHHNGMQRKVVTNPQKNHINKSAKALNYTKSSNATLEAGFSVDLNEVLLPHESYQVCFDYHAPSIGTLRFQMINQDGSVVATMITKNKKVNQWETICATMSFTELIKIPSSGQKVSDQKFVLYPDDRKWGTGVDQQFYFDNLLINLGLFSKAVKFSVDMNGYEHDCDHVFVSGTFNGWSGNTDTLYDQDKDGIWELEKRLFDRDVEYVFSIDSWEDKEYFSGTDACIVSYPDGLGGYYRNRVARVDGNMDMPVVCFGSCYSCDGAAELTWNLNMNSEEVSPDGVYLAGGDHFGHGKYEMIDEDGDGVYSITLEREKGFSSNYTFINGLCPSGWGCKENIVGQACADESHYSDRFLNSVYDDVVIDVCFGYCSSEGLCEVEQAFNVTFNLDARNLDMTTPIYLAGNTINGWSSSDLALSDLDQDGIYSVTVRLPRGQHLFKFVYGYVWEDLTDAHGCTITDPSGMYTNRYVNVVDRDIVLEAVMFEKCNGYVSTNNIDEQRSYFEVLPTIAEEYINLKFQNPEDEVVVLVYSMSGQLMSEQSVDTRDDFLMDVSTYDSGNYFITVQNSRSRSALRFMKI